ncbi:hypothetical protein GZL_07720 [Streptomyces sp. 769]|nr:hypothetical protein GZL_07720 [Streptomyces sp. 769]
MAITALKGSGGGSLPSKLPGRQGETSSPSRHENELLPE